MGEGLHRLFWRAGKGVQPGGDGSEMAEENGDEWRPIQDDETGHDVVAHNDEK